MKNSIHPFTVSVVSMFNSIQLRSEPMDRIEACHYMCMLKYTISKTTSFKIVVESKNHRLTYFTDENTREWVKKIETVRQ